MALVDAVMLEVELYNVETALLLYYSKCRHSRKALQHKVLLQVLQNKVQRY